MLKVHISLKSRKGETLVSAVGFIDIENKSMYIPKVSKKGMSYIDILPCEDLRKTDYGFIVSNVVVGSDDRMYMNTYYLTDLSRKAQR